MIVLRKVSEKGCGVITVEVAFETAKRHVQTLGADLILLEEPITSGNYGWVFMFQSRAFIETNDIRDALVGNAPILVDKNSGQIFTLGTAYEVEKYVNMYQCFGDPHAEPGPTIELLKWRMGAEKVAAVKEIRTHTQLGLKDAKEIVDACLEGQKPFVRCADSSTAEVLVRNLDAVGFEAKQLAL